MNGESDDPVPNVDALHKACDEARATVDHQITNLQKIDEKAIKVLRANILFIGLVLTALSVIVRSSMNVDRFVNFHTVLGASLLIGSCTVASITFLVTEYEPGISADALTTTVTDGLTKAQLHERLVNGYADWIEYNESALQVNGLLATFMTILVIDAIAFLTTGAIIGALEMSGTVTSRGVFGLLVVLLGTLSFVIYKFDLWVETHYVFKTHDDSS